MSVTVKFTSASLREFAMGFQSGGYIGGLNRKRISKLRDYGKTKYLENEKGKEITDRARIQEPSYGAPVGHHWVVSSQWERDGGGKSTLKTMAQI